MKRPVEIVQDIIAASDFPHDEIFLDSIPSEKLDSSNETQVLLTESDNGPSDYGNSEFVSLSAIRGGIGTKSKFVGSSKRSFGKI